MIEYLLQHGLGFFDSEIAGIYLDRFIHIADFKFILEITGKRRLQPLVKRAERFPCRLILYDPYIDMRMSDIRDSVFISVADMSAGDSGDLDGGFESDLRKHICILVFEDDFDSGIRHEFLGIGLHFLILDQDIESDVFHIIIKIRDRDAIVHIIQLSE